MLSVLALAGIAGFLPAQAAVPPPAVRMVTVEPGVQVEVLDWGGRKDGRPLLFLAGLGDTAHVYDTFAPRFTDRFHVYGMTRRGFGASSKPAPTDANYSAERLGLDVVAVIDALHLDRPVLVGHSIAGEELSFAGSHYRQKVAGLIYLDAADAYGFYDAARGDTQIDLLDVKRRLDVFRAGAVYDRAFVDGLRASVAQLNRDLDSEEVRLAEMPDVPVPPPPPPIPLAVWFGMEKFTKIEAPAMAIFACPHDMSPAFRGRLANDPMAQAALRANDLERCTDQSNAFERANPADPVVRIAGANHHIFVSNPDVVARAMRDFLGKLQ
ncbi:MAG TPA: alpha/beta hydrolase [Acidobacteriaceae bacterium]|jgi:pimeloyl-ACP methyl ester carboxylesterase|nr:alpha/beta hydrolase [Acidobacteriaceae bacterium]